MSHDSVPAALGVFAALHRYPSMALLTHQSCISRNRFTNAYISKISCLDLPKSQLNTRNRNLIREFKPQYLCFYSIGKQGGIL